VYRRNVERLERKRSEELGWKKWEETSEVAVHQRERQRIAEALCAR